MRSVGPRGVGCGVTGAEGKEEEGQEAGGARVLFDQGKPGGLGAGEGLFIIS